MMLSALSRSSIKTYTYVASEITEPYDLHSPAIMPCRAGTAYGALGSWRFAAVTFESATCRSPSNAPSNAALPDGQEAVIRTRQASWRGHQAILQWSCSAHCTCRLTEAEAMKVTALSARGRRLLMTASILSLLKQM